MGENLRKAAASDGTVVAYRSYGDGPRLVTCLHSLALDGSWYAPLADALGEEYSLLAPDFRGHGATGRGDSAPTLGLIAEDVAAVWDAENVRSSVVLGISLGGMIAQAVTDTYPTRVDAQILMATRGSFDEVAARGTLERAAEVRAPHGLERAVKTTMQRWFGDASHNHADPLVQRARSQFLRAGGDTVADYFEAMVHVGDFHRSSPPPTLVVGGDNDQSTPRAAIEELAASIPGAHLVFARGGHLVAFESPHEAASAVRPFLDSLDCWRR